MEEKPFHIELLQKEILKRKSANPRYSMRAFSRYLGLGPSTLSRILSHHQDLSLSASKKIIKKLKLESEDRRLFVASIAEEKKQRTLLSLASDDGEYLTTFEETLKTTRDMIFVLDRSCRCVHANESASRLLNLNSNQMFGRTLEQLGVDLLITKKINQGVQEVWEKGDLQVVDARYECFDNSTFEILLLPITNEEDKIMGIACHWRDISDTVVMEDYLDILLEAGQILSKASHYQLGIRGLKALLVRDYCDGVIIKTFHDAKTYQAGDKILAENFHHIFPLNEEQNPDFSSLMERGEPYKINHLDEVTFSLLKARPHELGSFLCVPLISRQQNLGILVLLKSFENDAFSARDEQFSADLGLRIAEMIDYSLLFEKCSD